MAVTKRQGREKPMKAEQRKVKGRSEDLSKDLPQAEQTALPAGPIYIRQAGRGWGTQKRRSQARSPPPPPRAHWSAPPLPSLSLGQHVLTPGRWILLLFSK